MNERQTAARRTTLDVARENNHVINDDAKNEVRSV